MREMLDGSLGGNMTVEMHFGSDIWPIEVDTGEMELAILNLCLNSRDAMPTAGDCDHVDNTQVRADGGTAMDFVKISVADTGQGMPPEVRARAFEPFFTTKDVNKGSGLGLPQVYGFARQSGGDVSIESDFGVGTIVTLMMPRSLHDPVSRPEAARGPDAKVDGTRRGHALLVEDDREVSALTTELLGALGFSVTHVASADAALGALANARQIDLVLSDIMMRGASTACSSHGRSAAAIRISSLS
jgi:hypothetical protein